MDQGIVLVTGGCGYIGSHVAKALTDSGERVLVLDDLSSGTGKALLSGQELIRGDIRDLAVIKQIFDRQPIETVIHLAALVNAAESMEKAALYKEVNAKASKQLFAEAVRHGVKHIIFASSAAVYGNAAGSKPISETFPLAPSNPYGESKVEAENYLRQITAGQDVNYCIFRFFNVAGAEKEGRLSQSQASRAIMQRLFAAAHEDDPEIVISGSDYPTPDGTVVRDFVHVEDVARAHLQVLTYLRQGSSSATLNLGSGTPTSMKQVLTLVEKVTGLKLNVLYGERKTGDIVYSLANVTQAKSVLGWQAEMSVEDMVRDGWKAYAKN